MIDAMFEKLISPDAMMEVVRAELKKCDPEYDSETAAFEAAVRLLQEIAGEKLVDEVHAALAGEKQTMGERFIFLFWQGVQQNLACFRDPKEKQFLELDYEDIHHEAEMNQFIPVKQRGVTPVLIEALPRQADEPLEQIIGYYSYLETVAYKLVHYKGFCFGDRFLKMVIPGYCRDEGILDLYCKRLEDDLGIELGARYLPRFEKCA